MDRCRNVIICLRTLFWKKPVVMVSKHRGDGRERERVKRWKEETQATWSQELEGMDKDGKRKDGRVRNNSRMSSDYTVHGVLTETP
eukprot:763061-Hanusia_phi.AAC.5